ncbi:MAG: 50S ribosomal protein L18 [Dehalococcoidia bacterium]|nr:50S ribosomal protein L18 [Dehalococcoidia bacterium]
MAKVSSNVARKRRHARIRANLTGTTVKPRLCVFRSLSNIYAQIIDDSCGLTLASAGSISAEIKEQAESKNKSQVAELVGSTVAKLAQDKGISEVVFDRGGYKYHGRIKALAESARKAGLKF